MVSTVTSYGDLRNRATPGTGLDGVVRVSVGGYYGTGALLFDGRAVLTAAHLFTSGTTSGTVHFETSQGQQSVGFTRAYVHKGYDSTSNNDLALVWLSASAPVSAERYQLYRTADELGKSFTLVGYGKPGTGTAGILSGYSGESIRQKATNVFDADMARLKSVYGSALAWSPLSGSQLAADFDSGLYANDALGQFLGMPNSGDMQTEGLLTSGDSGGPAFVAGLLAGVASYSTSLTLGGQFPDPDGLNNSTFGEIAAWQRVSYFQQWIDQTVRAAYPNAPSRPEDVQKKVGEGNSGTTYAYFLLLFTGVRAYESQVLSVDYATRDGTAVAGQDYLAVSGTLKLYPGETQAAIPVEIIGDTVPEPDEVFYLDVTNPVGGSFGPGVVTLTAMRTIVNDDGGVWA